MGKVLRNNRVGIVLGLYGLACLLLLLGLDGAVESALDRLRERTLVARAADYGRLERELTALTAEADSLQRKLNSQKDRQVPAVDELKQLSAAHSLRLTRMERQPSSGAGGDAVPVRYITSFRGSATSIVSFLRALEEQYLCTVDRVELWPADQSGTEVAVLLSLGVREP